MLCGIFFYSNRDAVVEPEGGTAAEVTVPAAMESNVPQSNLQKKQEDSSDDDFSDADEDKRSSSSSSASSSDFS
jgi:hypothetical protein